jgi:hypothetical protein
MNTAKTSRPARFPFRVRRGAVLLVAVGLTVAASAAARAQQQQDVIDLGAGSDDSGAPATSALPPPDTTPPAAPLTDAAPANPSADQNAEPAGTPIPPSPNRITNPVAVFSGLDKITGRITSFDVYVDETVQFGSLQVTPRACFTRPPTEVPRTDAFVQVDEIGLDRKVRRIFSGWMFADSPGLHAVDNPVYDVWLTNCKMQSNVPPPKK